jgi:O-antigen/teichoic acid export membrane protein
MMRVRRLMDNQFVRDTLVLQASKLAIMVIGGVSAIILYRLLGPAAFGVYTLASSLQGIVGALDFTGIGISSNTRLALAVGARDEDEILNILGAQVKISLLVGLIQIALVALVGLPLASALHDEPGLAPRLASMAVWLAFAAAADLLYLVPYNALQSRRAMVAFAALTTLNQVGLVVCVLAAALISPTPESVAVGRVVYSYSTLALGLAMYTRFRTSGDAPPYPPLWTVLRRAWSLPLREYRRRYLGFGTLIAVDKSLSNLFVSVPMQITGALSGAAAAGFLDLALRGIGYASVVTSAIFDNLQAVVPQSIGRGDFAGLWHKLVRLLLILAVGGALVFGGVAVVAPLFVPLLLGADWTPAIPALQTLAFTGAITTVGGALAPVYRALHLLGRAILAKLTAYAVGVIVVAALANTTQPAAVVGAWLINAIFLVSVGMTAALTLPILRRKAREPGAAA